ncbi:hypothetical protein [Streptomyces sp. NPDC049970]|uniref:hypothetical protein n=1 Tax=Streptomyces sp. NPDC049970 TaxID=3155033 RepID=UPI0034474423
MGELLHRRGWRTAFAVAESLNAWAVLLSLLERGHDYDIVHDTQWEAISHMDRALKRLLPTA